MNPSDQVFAIKQGFHKVHSRMGRSTESSFCILKVKKLSNKIASKISTKKESTKYVDPKALSPFDQNVMMFFDKEENKNKIFKSKQNAMESMNMDAVAAQASKAQGAKK